VEGCLVEKPIQGCHTYNRRVTNNLFSRDLKISRFQGFLLLPTEQ
jgi:hypothetical protein